MSGKKSLEPDVLIAHDWSESERRQYERHSVEFFLRVQDRNQGVVLGDVVDISLGGMKLLSAAPIPIDQHFDLSMSISLESGRRETISFEARSVWCQKDEGTHLYNLGFQFLNLSAEALRGVQAILGELDS
jgi:c-di-GMP-binding flagellar brake protein YcgR